MLARGWCSVHYRRWQKHGDPTVYLFGTPKTASVSDLDLAYAAGLIDGEGCFGMTNPSPGIQPNLYLTVSMTDKEPVEWLHETFGTGYVAIRKMDPPNRPQYRWRASGAAVPGIAEALLPYLKVKAEVARLAVSFRDDASRSPTHGRKLSEAEIERRAALKESFHVANATGTRALELESERAAG